MKVLITGGTNGMGKGVAKILARDEKVPHHILIHCRSKERGEETIQELKQESGSLEYSLVICDLTKLKEVERAIGEIISEHDFLDAIFINAGLGYAARRVETEDKMDPHFQVNYLSQFMLTVKLLPLLEKSPEGGRVIFNSTETGEIFWDDMQMTKKWHYERGIHQAMAAKRMFAQSLHDMYKDKSDGKISFIGFQISKTVWTNQINIIPGFMKFMATMMKLFGTFISIEECGEIMKPLFTESKEQSLSRSGQFITWKKNTFQEIPEEGHILDKDNRKRLWDLSLELAHMTS